MNAVVLETPMLPLTREQSDELLRTNYSQWQRLQWQEKEWERLEPKELPTLTTEQGQAVACGKMPCPLCAGDRGNTGSIRVLLRGKTTGIVHSDTLRCHCVLHKNFHKIWNEVVPPHDRDVTFKTLEPSEKSFMPLDMQARLIEKLKADSFKGWAFFGPAGWSKTTFCVALFRRALIKRLHEDQGCFGKPAPYVWRLSAKTLLEGFNNYVMSREVAHGEGSSVAPPPTVTRERIKAATKEGWQPALFLEEIDKVKMTKFRLDSLFEVIDALYEAKGQLVLNSNLTLAEFQEQFGPEFARRIAERCQVVDLHPKQ